MNKTLLVGFILLILSSHSIVAETKLLKLETASQTKAPHLSQNTTKFSDDDDDDDSDGDGEQELLEVSGAIVLRSDSSSMTSSRYGTDPYALIDINFTPNEQLELYLALFQSRDLDMDEAIATWDVLPNGKLSISAGRQYTRFGNFDTAMISSPLTEVMGITRSDKVLSIDTTRGQFDATAYLFESSSFADDRKNNKLDYGLSLDYENNEKTLGIHYMSNLASSDQFSSEVIDINIPGIAINGSIAIGPSINLTLEHIRTTGILNHGDLDGEITQRARPSASQIELDIDLKHSRVLALAWNKINGTEELIEDNIRKYVGVTYSQVFYGTLSGAIEFARYTNPDDKQSNSVNLRVIYSF